MRPVGASRAGTPWFLRAPQANGREVPRPGVMTQEEGSTSVGIQRGAASRAAIAGWVRAVRECSR